VPSWLDVEPISTEARRLWNEERRLRLDQIRDIELATKGNGTKAARAAGGKVERVQAEMEAEEKALSHPLSSILPCLIDVKWRDEEKRETVFSQYSGSSRLLFD
jgi:thiamine pyrophosphate-dependent acetolactate synthase large subunit-like protein